MINFADGNHWYLPITGLPYSLWFAWNEPGTYNVTATGAGNCVGTASTTVTVTGANTLQGQPLTASSLLFGSQERR
jgi:hypothetical protein